MPLPNTIVGDLRVTGNLVAGGMTIPSNSIGDGQIQAGSPGKYISPTKYERWVERTYAQPNTTATTETKPLHAAYGATGQVVQFVAGSIAVAAGAATVTIDLKKNGTSILTAPITLNNTNSPRVVVAASIASANYVVGDFFEVVVTATAGGGTLPTGVFAQMMTTEDPQ